MIGAKTRGLDKVAVCQIHRAGEKHIDAVGGAPKMSGFSTGLSGPDRQEVRNQAQHPDYVFYSQLMTVDYGGNAKGGVGKDNGPADCYPAERARQGWRASGFRAEHDSAA